MPDRLIWNEAELLAIRRQDYIRRALAAYGGQGASTARATAPRDTGAMAESISAQTVREADGWTARVSWDQAHAYGRFPDLGTRHIPAQHFLENALARYGRTSA